MKLDRPMTAGGGAFLACVGIAILIGSLIVPSASGNILLAGFGIGIVALTGVAIYGRKRGIPRPTNVQIIVLWLSIAAEMAVFFLIFPHLVLDQRAMTLAGLAVVGAHFLPMIVSFGPLVAWLGIACLGVTAIGALLPQIPLTAVTATDGALKLAFGLSMLGALSRLAPAQAAP